MRTRLHEREEELSRLGEAVTRAAGGRGAIVVFAGPPGAGKTTLLGHAAALAEERDVQVLSARGARLERELGFSAVRQLFIPPLRRLGREAREAFLDGAAGLAREALGLPGGVVSPAKPATPADAVFAAGHGLYWLTAGLAQQRPVLLCVDDAQWVDLPSLRTLAYLARRLDDLPVALALAHRVDLDDARAALVREIAAEPLARLCEPAPLSEHATAALVAERMGTVSSAAFAAACRRTTGGNPFLLRELLTAAERAGLEPTDAHAAAIEEVRAASIEQAVAARLAALPAQARELAEAVAVLGDGSEPALAAALAGVTRERVGVLADALAEADLLATAHPLDFAHPLVARAVYEGIARGRREGLHAHAARLLGESGADPGRVATHLLRTEPGGDPRELSVLRAAAADAVRRGAPEIAATLLARALRGPLDTTERLDLTIELGEARLAAGDGDGLADLRQAMNATDDVRGRAGLALRLGMARYELGDVAGARAAFAEGTELLADRPGEELLVSLQAGDFICARSSASGRELLTERLRPLLEFSGHGRTSIERLLLAQLAYEATQAGRGPHEGVAALARRAIAPPSNTGIDAYDRLALPLASMSLYFCDEYETVEEALSWRLERTAARGLVISHATVSFFRGVSRLFAGRLLDAIDDWEAVLVAAAEYGWAFALPSVRALRALAALEREEPALADELLALPGGDGPWLEHPTFPYVLAVRGHALDLAGRSAEGLALLLAAGERQNALASPNPALLPWRSHAGLAALRAGEPARAAALVDEELELARRFGAPRAIGQALRAAGLVRGDQEGIELLRQAVDALERADSRLELARALVDLGAALRRDGRRAEAREPLRRGLDLADRCGASAIARRAADELHTAGARPRRRRLSGAEALTAGERRVASLAAAGRTNREIAQALFISTNTVARHLTHAYEKLGIEGREGLAEALGEPLAA